MNILWICIEPLAPANTGGRVGIYQRLIRLANDNSIYLFYPYEDAREDLTKSDLCEVCKEIHAYPKGIKSVRQLIELAWLPYTVVSRDLDSMAKGINALLQRVPIDIVNIDFPHMMRLERRVPRLNKYPIVLNMHNVEWRVYQQIAKSKPWSIGKIAYWLESYRLKAYEKRILQKKGIGAITFVSTDDMQYCKTWLELPEAKLHVVPVGGSPSFFPINSGHSMQIAFVGNMSYGPNIEAIKWFTSEVMPTIQSELPQVKLTIVGKNPSQIVLDLAGPNVEVTGSVASMEPYYQAADLIVVPLLSGGGVKVKLLEAISYKKAVVSTSKGVEGTSYFNSADFPVCDEPEEFAAACISLLKNDDKRNECAERAYGRFLREYTWDAICKRYNDILHTLVSGARSAGK